MTKSTTSCFRKMAWLVLVLSLFTKSSVSPRTKLWSISQPRFVNSNMCIQYTGPGTNIDIRQLRLMSTGLVGASAVPAEIPWGKNLKVQIGQSQWSKGQNQQPVSSNHTGSSLCFVFCRLFSGCSIINDHLMLAVLLECKTCLTIWHNPACLLRLQNCPTI